jgi:hypothetical protein
MELLGTIVHFRPRWAATVATARVQLLWMAPVATRCGGDSCP